MKGSVGCILAALAAACAMGATTSPAASSLDRDEAAVYSLVIDSVLETAGDPFVVVAESTHVVGLTAEDLAPGSASRDSMISAAAVADFAARNRTPIPVPHRTLSGREIRTFRPASFDSGRDRDPSRDNVLRGYEPVRWLHILSRPGFDAERRRAIIVVGSGCGGFCGHVRVVLLVRDAHGWRVARSDVVEES